MPVPIESATASAVNKSSLADQQKTDLKAGLSDMSTEEKQSLAESLFKEATGRFPQDSGDRRAVYIGGLALVGGVFLVAAVVVTIVAMSNKMLPDWLGTLATALVSGVIGGLFGYAQQ